MVGPLIMIAPVCEPGVNAREVCLPPGVWYDFHTGKRVNGGGHAARAEDAKIDADAADLRANAGVASAPNRRCWMPAPPGRMPILVRGGCCLTLGAIRQSTREPLTKLILDVYPSDEPGGSWRLIEDAGDGCNHAHDAGAGAETDVDLGLDAAGPTLMIGQRRGGWRPHPRTLALRLHLAQRPERLLLDGRPGAD